MSAMGSHPSSPIKVTDLLLNMVAKAQRQDEAFLLDLAALQVWEFFPFTFCVFAHGKGKGQSAAPGRGFLSWTWPLCRCSDIHNSLQLGSFHFRNGAQRQAKAILLDLAALQVQRP